MKKILAYVLAFVLTLVIMLPCAFAETSASPDPSESASTEASPDSSTSPSESASADTTSDAPDIKADSYLLIDVKTGKHLLEHKPDDKIYPASTTKILTSLLVLEKESDLSKEVACGQDVMNHLNNQSSLMYKNDGLKPGEKLTVEQLLYGLMVVSGNDAANALAIEVGGSIDGFVQLMNQKAQELGMSNTQFANPHGLNNDAHYTTANDMATLTLKALENSKWKQIFTTKKYSMPKTNKHAALELETTDKLLSSNPDDQAYHYNYALGGKTGLTGRSGDWNGCIVALAEKDGRQLLCLLFGDHSDDANSRFVSAKKLFVWGFSQPAPVDISSILSVYTIPQKRESASELDEEDGTLELVPDFSNTNFANLTTDDINTIKSNAGSIQTVPNYTRNFKAPVTKGEVFGTVTFQYNGNAIGSANLVASRDVAASGDEAAGASSSASSPLQTQQSKELFSGKSISPWWWLLVPAVLGIVILLRVMTVNKRQRSRFKNKRKVYNYRIK